MPFVSGGIVIDLNRRAKAGAPVSAVCNHYIVTSTVAGRTHATQHVNVVVSGATGTINCQEDLSTKSSGIYRSTTHQTTTKAYRRDLIKGWGLGSNLRIRRADAPETAAAISAADKEVAIRSNVECSPSRRVRQTKRCLPRDTGVSGAIKQPAAASGGRTPSLVLKAVSRTIGSVDSEPLLVTPATEAVGLQFCPILPAVR